MSREKMYRTSVEELLLNEMSHDDLVDTALPLEDEYIDDTEASIFDADVEEYADDDDDFLLSDDDDIF